jgi:hypothetical protein
MALKINVRNENKNDHLVITLNTGGKFNLRELDRDNIQVLPRGFNWYCSMAPEKAQYLLDAIRETGHNKVVLTGSSKTGYAAILMAALMAPLAPEIDFRVCAFSPITYFHNGEPFFKGMSTNLRHCLDEGLLYDEIEAYGDLNKPLSKVKGNLKILVVHSSTDKWVEDIRYARHISSWDFVKPAHIPWEKFKGHSYPDGKTINCHKIMAYYWIHKRKHFYAFLDIALEMEDHPM